jgi:hypothetical protein
MFLIQLLNTIYYNLSIFYCSYLTQILTQASEVARPPHPLLCGLSLLIIFLFLVGFEIWLLPGLTIVKSWCCLWELIGAKHCIFDPS